MRNKYILFVLFILIACKKNEKSIAVIEFNKEANLGEVNIGDTIVTSVEIKNTSKNVLKINQIKSSCGCTVTKLNDSLIDSEQSTNLEIEFIADNQVGYFSKSIVISANTKPPFSVIYLKGKVK